MLPEAWQGIRRLLVTLPGNPDDRALLRPVLRVLRHNLPDSQITLLVSPSADQSLSLLPWIDEELVHQALKLEEKGGLSIDPAAGQSLVEVLRDCQFDAAIVLTHPAQSPYPLAYFCYLAGIPLRLGQSQEFGGSVLSHWVKPLPNPSSSLEHYLFLLAATGLAVPDALKREIQAI